MCLCSLTFELTPTAEAGSVSLGCDDATLATGQAYAACRSGSAVERGVRPHARRHEAGVSFVSALARARSASRGRSSRLKP